MIRFLLLLIISSNAIAGECRGRLVNPISDICWSCMLPITIGGVSMGKSGDVKNRDISNPGGITCFCSKAACGVIPGISIGFREPVRLIDITRTPYCMISLGGIKLMNQPLKQTAGQSSKLAQYHTHYYISPLVSWLELLTDFACLEMGGFDMGYMSELDPTYNNPMLSWIAHPEVFLFANHVAHMSCSADCAAANLNMPLDPMFWCAGCLGGMYPFNGDVGTTHGGVHASSLMAAKVIAKMHRMLLAHETSTNKNIKDGTICRPSLRPFIKKSQYKLQMTYPVPSTSGTMACVPLGMTDLLYGSGKEIPYWGEDFSYLLWRKRNCCMLGN